MFDSFAPLLFIFISYKRHPLNRLCYIAVISTPFSVATDPFAPPFVETRTRAADSTSALSHITAAAHNRIHSLYYYYYYYYCLGGAN